jgi:hypothetical protein
VGTCIEILAMMLTLYNAGSVANTPQESPLRIVWDLHTSPETAHVTQWLAECGWCWGIEVPPFASREDVMTAAAQGFAILGQIHGHPETRKWHWTRRGKSIPDIEAFLEMLRQANAEAPRVQFFMEDDSAGVGFSAEYLRTPPATHAEAKAMLDTYLDTAMAEVCRFPDVIPWAMAGFAGTAHHYARHGARCIIVERANDDIEDLQTAVAFARGASRQFGCDWGIDLSLWWGVIYGCVQDLPASFYTRHLWLSYISGAMVYRIEGGDLLVRKDGPTVVAKAIDDFARVAQSVRPGKADVPVAVMLPADHGWMTPAYWRTTNEAWNYARLPYRQGERAIDGFFGAAFPGAIYAQDPYPKGNYGKDDPPASPFALSCITPEFAPTPEQIWSAEPPIPFGAYANRDESRADFLENNIDPSPYRPMGDSRWGDIIDVLADDAGPDVIKGYDALILLGPIPMTDTLRDTLTAFVENGGRLVWAAGVASPAETSLVGAAIQPELRVGRGWHWRGGVFENEAFRYCPVTLEYGGESAVEVLAMTRSGEPLVLSHQKEKGTVYTCLLPWFEAGNTALATVALCLLDDVVKPLQPVSVSGPPVAWTSSRSEDACHVVIANHDDAAWAGTITVKDIPESFVACRNLVSDESVEFIRNGSSVTATLAIEPYGTSVLQWQVKQK